MRKLILFFIVVVLFMSACSAESNSNIVVSHTPEIMPISDVLDVVSATEQVYPLCTFDPENIKYPIQYLDETANIEITREWYYNAWCYIAHIQFTDYSRLFSALAQDSFGMTETASEVSNRLDAVLVVNGPYMTGGYAIIRNGVVHKDLAIASDLGIYNANTGIFKSAGDLGINGQMASVAVEDGLATDTFKFYNSTLVREGNNVSNPNNYSRAQRTFIATNGNPGDIYIVVADGRGNDGESSGLTKYECAKVILDLGCNYGIMLDGGGSSTMVFSGSCLNAVEGNERAVVDFICFK